MIRLGPHKPAMRAFYWFQFTASTIFMLFALSTGVGVTPETHGPLVYAIPAEAWAGALIAGASSCLLGIARNGHWPHSALLVLTGSLWLAGIYLFFVIAAWSATGGALVFSHAIGMAGLNLIVARLALCDARAGSVRW
ncbi:MAG: hypothetical protein RL268_857 [Pseudomonadota bacterium]|jgi:hypothetical protein